MPELAGRTLDHELALSRVGGDAELLHELAELFLEEYPRLMADLHAALERGDANGVERAAHGLKGSVASLGGVTAMELARDVEFLGRDQKLQEVRQVLQSLDIALVALRAELVRL
jgi:HPt (histidine-containing phosphotransfer) domain-containing protein